MVGCDDCSTTMTHVAFVLLGVSGVILLVTYWNVLECTLLVCVERILSREIVPSFSPQITFAFPIWTKTFS